MNIKELVDYIHDEIETTESNLVIHKMRYDNFVKAGYYAEATQENVQISLLHSHLFSMRWIAGNLGIDFHRSENND